MELPGSDCREHRSSASIPYGREGVESQRTVKEYREWTETES